MKIQEKVHKMCPNCGQISSVFKNGICSCGKQIESALFVENPMGFVESTSFHSGFVTAKTKSKK